MITTLTEIGAALIFALGQPHGPPLFLVLPRGSVAFPLCSVVRPLGSVAFSRCSVAFPPNQEATACPGGHSKAGRRLLRGYGRPKAATPLPTGHSEPGFCILVWRKPELSPSNLRGTALEIICFCDADYLHPVRPRRQMCHDAEKTASPSASLALLQQNRSFCCKTVVAAAKLQQIKAFLLQHLRFPLRDMDCNVPCRALRGWSASLPLKFPMRIVANSKKVLTFVIVI